MYIYIYEFHGIFTSLRFQILSTFVVLCFSPARCSSGKPMVKSNNCPIVCGRNPAPPDINQSGRFDKVGPHQL